MADLEAELQRTQTKLNDLKEHLETENAKLEGQDAKVHIAKKANEDFRKQEDALADELTQAKKAQKDSKTKLISLKVCQPWIANSRMIKQNLKLLLQRLKTLLIAIWKISKINDASKTTTLNNKVSSNALRN